MIRFSLLGSGSGGNATLIASDGCKVLIDNGLSLRQLRRRIEAIGETLDGLRGIVITHEHSDHVLGVGVLARRMNVPVFMTRATLDSLPKAVGAIPCVEHFDSGDTLTLDRLTLTSFRVAHDAADPVSFVVRSGGAQLGLATDLGSVSNLVRLRLKGSHALILESNYCPEMLRHSPYPPAIVQRIGGTHGHLSNADMNALLADLIHEGLELVVAMHISRENNTVEKARSMAAGVLKAHPARLVVADHDGPTPMFEVRGAGASQLENIA